MTEFRTPGRELAKAVIGRIEGAAPEDLQTLSYPIPTDDT